MQTRSSSEATTGKVTAWADELIERWHSVDNDHEVHLETEEERQRRRQRRAEREQPKPRSFAPPARERAPTTGSFAPNDRVTQLEARIATANQRIRELEQLQRDTMAALRNPKVKTERQTAVAVVFAYESLTSRNRADDRGFVPMPHEPLAEDAGLKTRQTAARHIKRLEDWGFIETCKKPKGDYEETWVKLIPKTAHDALQFIAMLDPSKPSGSAGKRWFRTCPDHPSAPIDIHLIATCSVCGPDRVLGTRERAPVTNSNTGITGPESAAAQDDERLKPRLHSCEHARLGETYLSVRVCNVSFQPNDDDDGCLLCGAPLFPPNRAVCTTCRASPQGPANGLKHTPSAEPARDGVLAETSGLDRATFVTPLPEDGPPADKEADADPPEAGSRWLAARRAYCVEEGVRWWTASPANSPADAAARDTSDTRMRCD